MGPVQNARGSVVARLVPAVVWFGFLRLKKQKREGAPSQATTAAGLTVTVALGGQQLPPMGVRAAPAQQR